MKRGAFLKLSSLGLVGLSSGFYPNSFLTSVGNKTNLVLPDSGIKEIFIEKNENWKNWLNNLVFASLITNLTASIRERYYGDCICDETSCYKSPSDYYDAIGIYGFRNSKDRFITQKVNDNKTNFNNISIPFLTQYNNSPIGNIEGPYLAGLCWAINSMITRNSVGLTKNVLIPKTISRNGGYRFDSENCYPTEYTTNHGKTQIEYTPKKRGKGTVKVTARDRIDNLSWTEAYDFSYA